MLQCLCGTQALPGRPLQRISSDTVLWHNRCDAGHAFHVVMRPEGPADAMWCNCSAPSPFVRHPLQGI